MVQKVQSAGGVVYYMDQKDHEPKFLLVKRHALSKKIERIAPKGKIQKGELADKAALREVEEEVGLPQQDLQVKKKLDTISLQLFNNEGKLGVDKDITYFLVEYKGQPDDVEVQDGEGYLGMYKWASIQEVLSLVEYRNLRELIRQAYGHMAEISVKDKFIQSL